MEQGCVLVVSLLCTDPCMIVGIIKILIYVYMYIYFAEYVLLWTRLGWENDDYVRSLSTMAARGTYMLSAPSLFLSLSSCISCARGGRGATCMLY